MAPHSQKPVVCFPSVGGLTATTIAPHVEADERTVDVWSFVLEDDASELQRCHTWLSEKERARAQRLIHAEQRSHFVLAHGGLRGVLARYLALEPEAIEFQVGSNGKPSIWNQSGALCLRFNLSHSHGRMLVAVTKGREVGIDVERVRDKVHVLKLAERFYADAEYQDLKNRTEPDRTRQFYRYWVAKEALLKGQGRGLQSLQQCEIRPSDSPPSAKGRVSPQSAMQSGWTIQWLDCGSGWQGAVSAYGSDWTVRMMDG
jgi:4'-phosphopantetheinyl transferase